MAVEIVKDALYKKLASIVSVKILVAFLVSVAEMLIVNHLIIPLFAPVYRAIEEIQMLYVLKLRRNV